MFVCVCIFVSKDHAARVCWYITSVCYLLFVWERVSEFLVFSRSRRPREKEWIHAHWLGLPTSHPCYICNKSNSTDVYIRVLCIFEHTHSHTDIHLFTTIVNNRESIKPSVLALSSNSVYCPYVCGYGACERATSSICSGVRDHESIKMSVYLDQYVRKMIGIRLLLGYKWWRHLQMGS